MSRFVTFIAWSVLVIIVIIFSGCLNNEARIREIAKEEAKKMFEEYKQSYKPEKFEFGISWEKDYSFSQATRVGNMIFLAGQFSHDTEIDKNGLPLRDFQTGKSFEVQLRQTLENMKKVLAKHGATMDDVVFLQHFVDTEAGRNKAGNYLPVLSKLIKEYFPKGLQGMTCVEVEDLFGEEQLIESNAIAVVH